MATELATWIAARASRGQTTIVGINGAQGCGKSTLAAKLCQALGESGLSAEALALDDFYLTHAKRQQLARNVHPLLATRGVPGTHDVALAQHTIERMRTLRDGEVVRVPRFIKMADDRAPERDWGSVAGPIDVVLFEGWCVGTPPQREEELIRPVNALESSEDADGRWRASVNEQLSTTYAALFGELDQLIFLKAPSFDVVHGWRLEQEAGNVREAPGAAHVLSAEKLRRFIAHYERLTCHALRVLPERADVVLELDAQRRVIASHYR
jgi:D-glycerate 3-kinase